MTPNEECERAAARVNAAHEELEAARRQQRVALRRRQDEPGKKPAVCGSPTGYRVHQRAEEAPCWACQDAWTWYRWRSKR